MIDPNRRDLLWKEYYRAVHSGNKAAAERILKVLHSPPSNLPSSRRGPGVPCKKCRGRLQ